MPNSVKYLIVAILTFITGYLFLRFAYHQSTDGYEQEIVLIVLGTIATMAVTASLINKQSEVELQKEQRVKIFDLKSELYIDLINFIEKIVTKGNVTDGDMVALEFLTHKISIIASPEVLKEYSHLIETIKKVSRDKKITPMESDELSLQLARLGGKIRYDLILKDSKNKDDIESLIESNINKL
jgi:hypothetical protein